MADAGLLCSDDLGRLIGPPARGYNAGMDTTELHNLPIAEKLKLVTQLWDEIAASCDSIVVPPEILADASRRSTELKADPSIAIDDKELWRRVDG